MSFLKNIFGGSKKSSREQPVGRISVAPSQSQEEQDQNRNRMEAELDASRASREARKTAGESQTAE